MRLLSPARDASKKTVVLDMDETLLHSVKVADRSKGDIIRRKRIGDMIEVVWPDGFALNVYLRPGVDELLRELSSLFEVVLWTAGTAPYAQEIVNVLDSEGTIFSSVIARDRRWFKPASDGFGYAKDLKALGRPMDKILIVENNLSVCRYNYSRTILVPDWDTSSFSKKDQDTSLSTVLQALKEWSDSDTSASEFLESCNVLHRHNAPDKRSFFHATFPYKTVSKL
eukprot:TRINITY_DN14832_c0_g2_i2.p1 TRINITY_DN14832_c0_g2~~TRINITY_DN14832_c0_g2_i2.p1  ORF type:complete len:226 (+),score=46.37 TRINITY_DN14832_c0_g2_i2:45-722(+)